MNYIQKLLNGEKVEWRTLGEVCLIANNKRKPIRADNRISGKTPYYGANNIQDYVEGYTHDGEYILIAEDGSKSLENYSIQYVNGKFWANNHIHIVSGKEYLDNRFLFHWLSQYNFKPFLNGGDRAKLTTANLIKIQIPIPPLAVQQKIAEILDRFAELEAELEAELHLREKQYNYYRNHLLTPNEQGLLNGKKVEWKSLGEVCNFRNGFAFKSNKFKEEGEAILRIGNIQNQNIELSDLKYFDKSEYKENLKPFEIKKGDILVAMSGATTGKVGMLKTEGVFYLNQRVGKFEPIKDILNNNYLYHYLLSQTNQLYILAGGGAQPNLSSTALMEKIKIPIPPMEEQERIVKILDKFDILVNSISEGLPKEIALRRKQYEYYREQLLSFPEN
ncbi:restriction endonuclease subunit S [Ornithobacterium rhinotracheale]|uniref:restriction endonuclease subunit S n=1 Tax=Ornithobacterium rhinotracheale TaxID=28251 RepID=UPI003FA4A01B